MTPIALALVLASAGIHATWNLLAKGVGGDGGAVAWTFATVGAIALLPWGVWTWRAGDHELGLVAWAFLLGSALLHVGYMVSLQKGYGAGDLSIVYPLARGTGPALATVAAIALLGERPSLPALSGTALVVVSAFALTGGASRPTARALGMGLTTGVFIAAYTLWDATAVSRIGIAPILFAWLSETMRALLLAPVALRRRRSLAVTWRRAWRSMIMVGVLSPLAYLLVLEAFRLAPVSLVAPAREISILLTVALGTGLLGEAGGYRRLVAGAGMAVGVALVARG